MFKRTLKKHNSKTNINFGEVNLMCYLETTLYRNRRRNAEVVYFYVARYPEILLGKSVENSYGLSETRILLLVLRSI